MAWCAPHHPYILLWCQKLKGGGELDRGRNNEVLNVPEKRFLRLTEVFSFWYFQNLVEEGNPTKICFLNEDKYINHLKSPEAFCRKHTTIQNISQNSKQTLFYFRIRHIFTKNAGRRSILWGVHFPCLYDANYATILQCSTVLHCVIIIIWNRPFSSYLFKIEKWPRTQDSHFRFIISIFVYNDLRHLFSLFVCINGSFHCASSGSLIL